MKHASLKLLAPLAFVILLGAGCAGSSQPKASTATEPPKAAENSGHVMGSAPAPSDADHTGDDHIAKLAGSRVDLKNRNNLKPGNVEFSFKLYGEDGHPFGPDDLNVEHEKKMHFLIVRDDMTEFQHVHPEYKNGLWTVTANLPKQGNYQLYVDIAPIEEKASVLRVPVTIGGPTLDAKAPTPNADWSVQDGTYTAKLTIDQPLKTKEMKQWSFAITENGKPVTDLKPYLGAFGHVVELRHTDEDDFFHVHPMTEEQPKDGKVVFQGSFPVKGRYTLYAQFNVSGSVKTFPITIDVNEEGVASPAMDSDSSGGMMMRGSH